MSPAKGLRVLQLRSQNNASNISISNKKMKKKNLAQERHNRRPFGQSNRGSNITDIHRYVALGS